MKGRAGGKIRARILGRVKVGAKLGVAGVALGEAGLSTYCAAKCYSNGDDK